MARCCCSSSSTDAAAALPWLATATLHQVDLRDSAALREVVLTTTPGEVYNLAGLSSVGRSWNEPVLTAELNAVPVAVLLAAVREVQQSSGVDVRFVQASSAEIFGDPLASPQDEGTPVEPTNPYGTAKAYAHHIVATYRSLGLHASSVVLYNHESPGAHRSSSPARSRQRWRGSPSVIRSTRRWPAPSWGGCRPSASRRSCVAWSRPTSRSSRTVTLSRRPCRGPRPVGRLRRPGSGARAACLRAVVADADDAGADRLLLVRDDTPERV